MGYLDLGDVLIRLAHPAQVQFLALVMPGDKKFAGGAHHSVLSAHLHRLIFVSNNEDRITLHKLTDHGVEVVVPSSHHEPGLGARKNWQ